MYFFRPKYHLWEEKEFQKSLRKNKVDQTLKPFSFHVEVLDFSTELDNETQSRFNNKISSKPLKFNFDN